MDATHTSSDRPRDDCRSTGRILSSTVIWSKLLLKFSETIKQVKCKDLMLRSYPMLQPITQNGLAQPGFPILSSCKSSARVPTYRLFTSMQTRIWAFVDLQN